MGKCPICGAPMQGASCEYCGYKERVENLPETKRNVRAASVYVNNVPLNYSQSPMLRNKNCYVAPNGDIYSNKSRLAAALLCIFLGYLGIHRFYTGKIFTGLIYMFTAGLFGVGIVVDLVRILCGTFNDKYGFKLR